MLTLVGPWIIAHEGGGPSRSKSDQPLLLLELEFELELVVPPTFPFTIEDACPSRIHRGSIATVFFFFPFGFFSPSLLVMTCFN